MKFQLIRGSTLLGVVTHDSEAGQHPWDVGWLEPSSEFDAVSELFVREQQYFDRLVEMELSPVATLADTKVVLVAQAQALQIEIMRLGVRMSALEADWTQDVTEIHIARNKVFWR
ncbi:MAG: hypothetical protein K2R98_21785 [Gemmataceae bacterium]|nr:hypothetical protein [Gemmataceae bacterium]